MRTHGRWSILLLAVVLIASACNTGGGTPAAGPSAGPSLASPGGPNVLPMVMNPLSGSACNYANEPCTTVTVCVPNTTTCQVISDVLVDTGSSGLRIFLSVLTIPLTPQRTTVSGQSSVVGECTFFGSGAMWGTVDVADVVLGDEPAVQVPIQVIDPTFANQYTATGQPQLNVCGVGLVDSSPSQAGYNGILGVGLFPADGQVYYAGCERGACTQLALTAAQQVQNPVSLLPTDNNGVVIQLPAIASDGAASASGWLILGIGTAANNRPSGVTVFSADQCGNIVTTYKNTVISDGGVCSQPGAFLDTGSNGLYFADGTIQQCVIGGTSFYCPTTLLMLSAAMAGSGGSPSQNVAFEIANANALFAPGRGVFSDLGGPAIGLISGDFDWGIPFFLGRTVYIGLANQNSMLGVGPYYAY